MLHPVLVIALRPVLMRVRPARFLALVGRPDGDERLAHQILELQRFNQIGVPDQRLVLYPDMAHLRGDLIHACDTVRQAVRRTENGGMALHRLLHLEADFSRTDITLRVAHPVEPVECLFSGFLRRAACSAARGTGLGRAVCGGTAEHYDVEKRVSAKAVGTMDRDTGRLANGHQARHGRAVVSVRGRNDLAVIVRRDTTHVVVNGRQHRNRLAGHIDAAENLRRLGDARKPLVQRVGINMLEMQHDVVLVRAHTAAFIDLDRHGTADDIAACEVLGRRRKPFHETLALGIGQIAAFTACAFGDQHTGAINACRVELHELHVLERQAGAKRHRIAVTCAGMRRSAGEIDPAVTARRQNGLLAPEAVQRAVFHAQRDDTGAFAILVHQQIEREILDMEMRLVLQALLVKRMENGVSGAVGGGAGTACH